MIEFENCGQAEIDYIKNWIWVSDLALENAEDVNELINDLQLAKKKLGW